MNMMMGETWGELGSRIAGLMLVWATLQQFFPPQLRVFARKLSDKCHNLFYPYIQITIQEHPGGTRNEVYTAVKTYLSVKSSKQAKKLKADMVKNSKSFVVGLDNNEEVTDEFEGAKLWWTLTETIHNQNSGNAFSFRQSAPTEKRFFKLSFHKKHREMVTGRYLSRVVEEGKALELRNRQRKLYTNNSSYSWELWNHIVFDHPATFETLAMDPKKKKEIIDDLIAFSNGKEHYKKVGKAWKRGYLLYGPPGTGKSTMIAAMANFLNYDLYDLELTSVKNNNDLRKLLIDTKSKSVIVIEDIDCSIDLTGKRKKKKKIVKEETEKDESISEDEKEDEGNEKSKITLSGLLNVIDGIWSSCGPERVFVFTTNHLDKLDPALIRRGRMDMHIEMSYCKFEAFKVLAKNYLDIETHPLFEQIESLLEENDTSPCDVAENLMPKSASTDADACLKSLIQAVEAAKEKARLKTEEESKTKKKKSAKKSAKKSGHCMKMIRKLTRQSS